MQCAARAGKVTRVNSDLPLRHSGPEKRNRNIVPSTESTFSCSLSQNSWSLLSELIIVLFPVGEYEYYLNRIWGGDLMNQKTSWRYWDVKSGDVRRKKNSVPHQFCRLLSQPCEGGKAERACLTFLRYHRQLQPSLEYLFYFPAPFPFLCLCFIPPKSLNTSSIFLVCIHWVGIKPRLKIKWGCLWTCFYLYFSTDHCTSMRINNLFSLPFAPWLRNSEQNMWPILCLSGKPFYKFSFVGIKSMVSERPDLRRW